MKNKIITLIISVSLILSSFCLLANAASWSLGDVNGDGRITASDARYALRISANLEKNAGENTRKAADANGDGRVTASDARQILRWSAGLDRDTNPEKTSQPSTTKPQESTTKKPTTPETDTKRPSEPPTTPKYKDGEIVSDYPNSISDLLNGRFYMKVSASTFGFDAALAVRGNNTEIRVYNNDGAALGFFMTKSETYIKLVNVKDGAGKRKNYYVDNLDAFLSAVDSNYDPSKDGSLSDLFKELDIQALLGELNLGSIEEYGNPVYTSGNVGGKACDVFTFTVYDDVKISFYTENDDIIQIGMRAAEDEQDAVLLEDIDMRIGGRDKIPADMFEIQGFEQTNILAFVTLLNNNFADLFA